MEGKNFFSTFSAFVVKSVHVTKTKVIFPSVYSCEKIFFILKILRNVFKFSRFNRLLFCGVFSLCVCLCTISQLWEETLPPIVNRGESRGGAIGAIAPPTTYESNFIHNDFCSLENNIPDIRPFCRPLFCHSSVVNFTSSLLQ